MDEVKFCAYCGKLTSSCYNYCPWCGKSLESRTDVAAALDKSLGRIEKIQSEDRLVELEKLENCLDLLDQELEAFLPKSSR